MILLKITAFPKMASRLALFFIPLLIVFSCKEKALHTGEEIKNCTFEYDAKQVGITWTAYKFTERAGVSGRFDEIQVRDTVIAAHPAKVFEGASFLLDPKSINTDNPERDQKIRKSFFGALKENGVIRGYINDVDFKKGKGSALINLNGVEKKVSLEFSLDKDFSIEAKGTIDLKDFGGLGAIDSLNKVCHDLHIGKDGISKLWPDVSLRLSAKPVANCAKD